MIQDLRLQQFRSYQDASFEFESGVNIIVGPNASGKTNLLEALLVLASGKSYRAKDRDLVQHDMDWARLDALVDNKSRVLKLQTNTSTGRVQKTFKTQELEKSRLQLADTLPVVVFEPTDLQLLTGSPVRRRAFLDTLLTRTLPDYSSIIRDYERTLAQRNALLKRGNVSPDELFVWNLRLSEFGGRIAKERCDLVKNLNKEINNHYESVAGVRKNISLQYKSDIAQDSYGTGLLKALEKNTKLDLLRGFTGSGPHRDDFVLLFHDRPIADVASRGEVRTLILGLKLLELSIVEVARNQKPILLLDDVFSELDGARRKALTDFLSTHQTFITTTDADVVVEHFMNSANVIAL